jgi:hypothetical protein
MTFGTAICHHPAANGWPYEELDPERYDRAGANIAILSLTGERQSPLLLKKRVS